MTNLNCPNCNSTLGEKDKIILTVKRDDKVNAYECNDCGGTFSHPEDFSDSIYHKKELNNIVVNSKRGDEYEVEYCEECGFYSIVG